MFGTRGIEAGGHAHYAAQTICRPFVHHGICHNQRPKTRAPHLVAVPGENVLTRTTQARITHGKALRIHPICGGKMAGLLARRLQHVSKPPNGQVTARLITRGNYRLRGLY